MTSVRALLADARHTLAADDALREAEILVAHALQQSRAWLFAHGDDEVADAMAAAVQALVAQRAAGEPIAYLTGRRAFWSFELDVSAAVLIPRPETELLVELALRQIPQSEKVDILDLGTGSGAIALALAHERPHARVTAVDASRAALDVAQKNAQRLQLSNVEFLLSDWYAQLPERTFEFVVGNPPYIAEDDRHLMHGDLRFEPRAALAAGNDGLSALRHIVAGAPRHVKPSGWLLLEHGFDQGDRVQGLLTAAGFIDVSTYRDVEHRDRVTVGRLSD